jgi:hypothetical protein
MSNPTYKASIVMPLKTQRDSWLEESVLSAVMQTALCEVLVITSDLTPQSNLDVLSKLSKGHSNLKVLRRPSGAQFAGAINFGFESATCDRVGLLLTDDILDLATVATCLSFDADIVATARCGMNVDMTERLWEGKADPVRYQKLKTIEERASYIDHFMLLNRALVLKIGGVDPNIGLTGADDYDMVWTLLEAGASVKLIPEFLYRMRDHGETRLTMRDQNAQVADLRKILAKHGICEEDIERLVEAKKKWYGTPGYVAIQDPDWYMHHGEFQEGSSNSVTGHREDSQRNA